ncbi:hypothetical protein JHK82_028567 [Glycine max]|uniref:Uncharacterized protein n=2 Tax=Glycine subgen. Soja TaxID=1462606 RepID=A0A0R0I393_SOYBN|nr:hypothetical protein JHK85_029236 [Glycine max]RZB87952.1 hypothetical protein D0Y65_027461 [Glycine soja]KAG5004552.1 hypothetical protein JHK86_028691 [Glycine max]KAG5127732.1 hypothetical protein JHK82_028567 [Glycine max]KAG5152344.1 hypothetical protein JHK84_028816 [Glycine max]
MVLPSHPIGPTLTKVANQKHLRLHKVVVSCHRHQPLVRGQSSERIMHLSPFENMQHPLFGASCFYFCLKHQMGKNI